MPVQQTLRQKIFETKKRLSKPSISDQNLWCMGVACLLVFLTIGGILLTRTSRWGIVMLDIPVASQPPADEMLNHFREDPETSLNATTSVLALTPKELIIGDIASFTSQKSDPRNKFVINHLDGSPQVSVALDQMEKWRDDRKRRLGIRHDNILILLPDAAVPIAIVSAVADKVRKTKDFSHIIMGGGLM